MANKGNEKVTAKEIAENLSISFEFLAKALQSLMRNEIIDSQQGVKGGYFLARKPEKITISDVISALDENQGVVDCLSESNDYYCLRIEECNIRNPIIKMQHKINGVLKKMTIADLIEPSPISKIERTDGVINE